jgi:hypothetical protein
MAGLQTVDLKGVDILRAGGPYHGAGSPQTGDFYTVDDLKAIADETRQLMDSGELKAPNKLGHSQAQRLLTESGYSDGEMPAAGWLENVRVEGDRLKADVRGVPAKLGELIKARAFRTRSTELRRFDSQSLGRKTGPVVAGLAWLGAKMPAVRTLDDIVALYQDQDGDLEDVTLVTYEDSDAWDPSLGYRWIQAALTETINQGDERFYVADVGPESALVVGNGVSWVVPFKVTDDDVQLAEKEEWSLATPAWERSARDFTMRSERVPGGFADTTDKMAEITLTEEQVREFADRLGIEGEFTFDDAVAKVDELKTLAEAEPPPVDAALEERLAKAEADAAAGREASQKLYEFERDAVIDQAIEDAKIDPADREKWSKRYDENQAMTVEVLADLAPREEFKREFGFDGSTGTEEDALFEQAADLMGIPVEDRAGVRS